MKETYFKHQGDEKGTEIDVESQKYLSEGGRGVVYQVEVKIGNHGKIFVIKEFFKKSEAQDALENYQRAKEAGLKVFTTYRIDETGYRVIMTSGHTKTDVCLGSVNEGNSLKFYGLPKIQTIANLDEFLHKYFQQAEIAASKQIHITSDTPFFFVKKGQEDSPLDFVLGDTDYLNVYSKRRDPWHGYKWRLEENIKQLTKSFRWFLSENVDDYYVGEHYIKKAEEYTNKLLESAQEKDVAK